MLNKWQSTATILLTKEDLKTPVFFVKDSSLITDSSKKTEIDNIVKETIVENIKYFLQCNEPCGVLLHVAKDGVLNIFTENFNGFNFIDYYWNEICTSDGFRIELTKETGEQSVLIIIKQ